MIYELWREWHLARDFILPALDIHKTHSEDDILVRLATGEYKLWREETCAAVTRFVQYPRFKAIETIWGGGDLEGLKVLRHKIENFGRASGCKESVASARLGWTRIFPEYAQVGALFYKEL